MAKLPFPKPRAYPSEQMIELAPAGPSVRPLEEFASLNGYQHWWYHAASRIADGVSDMVAMGCSDEEIEAALQVALGISRREYMLGFDELKGQVPKPLRPVG